MILLVLVRDSSGNLLERIEGPVTPEWCGTGGESGEREKRDYAGLPGKAYAKVLQEDWTHEYPSGSYWNPVSIRSDNRIPAYGRDTSSYLFDLPRKLSGPITVEVKLLFRRAFIKLQRQKGWDTHDILMEKALHELSSS
jgi:hypothetical protein